jgi:Yip1 domain
VSRLDRNEVLELKTDKTATGQSIGLLVLAGLSYGIGFTLLTEFRSGTISPYGIIVGTLVSMFGVCFAAFVWAATLFLVGTKIFQGKTSFWELSRPLFFSTGPFLFFALISIPVYAFYVTLTLVIAGWLIASQIFVLKQVMGFNAYRTVLTFTVGFLILLFVWLQFG